MTTIKLPASFKLIARFITGSRLYGTHTENSDIDIRGVFIPNKKYFYGFLHRTEQYEDKVNDVTYFEIRKFMKLAIDNNPNIIEFLFIPDKYYMECTEEWLKIIESKHLFISKKAKYTFTGYAHSQFNRIKRHRGWLLNPPKKKPERKDYGLPDDRSLISKEQIGAFNILLSLYLEEIRKFHELQDNIEKMEETHNFKAMCQQMSKPDMNAIKTIMPVSDNFIEALEREKAYMNAKNEWDQYQNWKQNRNPMRAKLEELYGYDTKHASHLYRLLTEGEELLTTGNITFPRPDASLIRAIKSGCWSYEKLMENVMDYDDFFNSLYEQSKLPYGADKERIDILCREIVEDFLTKG